MPHGETIVNALYEQKELETQLAFEFASQRSKRPYRVEFTDGDVTLNVEVDDFDRFGLLLREVKLTCGRKHSGAEKRRRFSNQVSRLVNEVTYLSGHFELIEQDQAEMVAVLRTVPMRNGGARFYEAELRSGGQVVLSHYDVKPNSSGRTRSDGNISMEAFRILMDHLTELLK